MSQYSLYRKLSLEYLGNKCARCGSTERLHIHHKDVNPENNDVSNLELLCTHHHMTDPHPNGFPKDKLGITMSSEQQVEFRKENRLRMKLYRDRKRVRKYAPRKKKEA